MLASTILESSFYIISSETQPYPPACRHQYQHASTQATNWAEKWPHPLADLVPKDPLNKHVATLGPDPVHQRAQNMAPNTSMLALTPGPLQPCSQRTWDPALATSGPRQASHISRETPAPGPPQPCSIPYKDTTHPLAGWYQLKNTLGLSASHPWSQPHPPAGQ